MEGQILIFRTSIRNARDIKHIAALFTLCPQIYKWNVDMEESIKNRMSGHHPD